MLRNGQLSVVSFIAELKLLTTLLSFKECLDATLLFLLGRLVRLRHDVGTNPQTGQGAFDAFEHVAVATFRSVEMLTQFQDLLLEPFDPLGVALSGGLPELHEQCGKNVCPTTDATMCP